MKSRIKKIYGNVKFLMALPVLGLITVLLIVMFFLNRDLGICFLQQCKRALEESHIEPLDANKL